MGDSYRVLVTGGAGFIGSHLADQLLADCYKVTILSDFSSRRIENPNQLRNAPLWNNDSIDLTTQDWFTDLAKEHWS